MLTSEEWYSILKFVESLGFELDTIQFKHSNGNVVTVPFEKLQNARGVALLHTLLTRAVSKVKCIRCDGYGWIVTIKDCHQSAGTVPCPDCQT